MKLLAHGNIQSEPIPNGYRWTLSPKFNRPDPLIGEVYQDGYDWILRFAPRYGVGDQRFPSLQAAEDWVEGVWANNGGLL